MPKARTRLFRRLRTSAPAERTATDGLPSFHGVARGGIANVAGAALSASVNLVLLVVIARALPIPQAGAVFATTSLFLLTATACRLGVDVSIVHFLAGARARNQPQDIAGYLRAGLVPVAIVGGVAAAVLTLTAPALLDLVLGDTAVPHGRALMAALGVTVPVAATYDVVVGATRGLGAVRPTVVLERLVRPALQVILVTAAVAAGGQAFAVICAWAAPYAAVGVVAALWLRRLLPHGQQRTPSEHESDLRLFWRFTLPRALAAMAQIALQRLDILLVGAMRGAAAAAVYTAATRFLVLGQLGNQAISYAVQPRLAMLVALEDFASARRLYQLSTVWIMALTWPLFLVALVAAPVVLEILGPSYDSGSSTMVVLALAMLAASACGLVDIVLITVGKTGWNLADTLAAFVVNVALNVALIPALGIAGAATAWAVSIVVRNCAALTQIGRRFQFHPVSRLSVTVGAQAVVCFAAVPALSAVLLGLRAPVIAVAVVAGALVYGWQLYRLRQRLQLDVIVAPSSVASRL
ncbi:MAG: oligosaccharide flippase family protein [Actinomycetota bacterium]|nr:oligosaccharide flippase family protein [Actinomycetota bacterium]